MQAIDLVRDFLKMTDHGLAVLLEGVKPHAMTPPTPRGNHPIWVLGHLCYIEGTLHETILGEPNPAARFEKLFAPGSTPSADPSIYPSFDELLRTFRELRAATLAMVDRLGEARMGDRPKAVPQGFEDAMKTNAHTFLLICMHQMVHYGQVTDTRRLAGIKPRM